MEIMNLRPLAKLSLGLASVALLGGCYHQATVFRAVSDVTVTRPGDAGSSGPLVLVASKPGATKESAKPVDIGGVFDRMSLDQIGILEPHMGLLLRARHDADASLAELRSSPNPDPVRLKAAEEKSATARKQVENYSHEWREMQRKIAIANSSNAASAVTPSGEPVNKEAVVAAVESSQTVLMASEKKSLGNFSSSFARTVVLIIDGPPKPGQYWLTADNSVLITSSAWSAPARSRVNLVGSVKILEVHGNRIFADVAIRETTEGDTSEYLDHIYDPAYYQTQWLLQGKHTFEVTSTADPVFEKAAVHWVTE
jgi:hypothetical protein